jgi:16S rRNA processing protein RimM
MKITDCFELGHITKTHGLKGEVVFFLDVDFPEEYDYLESVFVEVKNELVPFFIESIQIRQKKAIVKFEDINTFEQASNLLKHRLFLPLDELPELEEGQFYYHDVIGYQVIDNQKGTLGVVKEFYSMPQGDLLVMEYEGKEVLIPVNDNTVTSANHELQEILVHIPDGLLEVYLNP